MADSDALIGKTVSHYRVQEKLGGGGTIELWRFDADGQNGTKVADDVATAPLTAIGQRSPIAIESCIGSLPREALRPSSLLERNQCLPLQPKSPDLLLNAGIVDQQLGDTNRALDTLEKAAAWGVSTEMLRDTLNFDVLSNNLRFQGLIQSVSKK